MPDELAPLRDFADRFFHDALRNPENLREFLMDAVPTLAPGLDFSRVNYIEPTFLLPNWLRREADLLFEIPYRFGGAERKALVCILIEHQTRPDPRLPLRMLLEVALYWERQLREWEKAAVPKGEFRLTPVLPIVLHSGGRPWGSARTISDMLGPPAAFFPFAPAWGPVFWELSQHSPEELLNAESAFLQVLTVVRMEDEERAEFRRFFQKALGKVDSIHGTNRVRWVQMIQLIYGWVLHRRPGDERQLWIDLGAALQEDELRKEEIRAMAQLVGKTIFDEGQEYRARLGLLAQGRKRFGEPAPEIVLDLNKIADLERLERMTLRILEVSSWTELLDTP
jgi:hypothetical protein